MPDFGPQVDEWFADRGVEPSCTQCGHDEFGGGELVEFHAPALDEPDGIMRGYTVVPIMCKNCGHFELFSAELMGLVEDEDS